MCFRIKHQNIVKIFNLPFMLLRELSAKVDFEKYCTFKARSILPIVLKRSSKRDRFPGDILESCSKTSNNFRHCWRPPFSCVELNQQQQISRSPNRYLKCTMKVRRETFCKGSKDYRFEQKPSLSDRRKGVANFAKVSIIQLQVFGGVPKIVSQ